MTHDIKPEPHDDETSDPQNPPNAVVTPAARTAALVTFLGGIILFFVLFGAGLLFWTVNNSEEAREPSGIGTSGEPRTDTGPGGFDPAPEHDSTGDELEHRGVDEPTQGPMPGLISNDDENADRQ